MTLVAFSIVFAAIAGGFLVLHEFSKSKSLSEQVLEAYRSLLIDARRKRGAEHTAADVQAGKATSDNAASSGPADAIPIDSPQSEG